MAKNRGRRRGSNIRNRTATFTQTERNERRKRSNVRQRHSAFENGSIEKVAKIVSRTRVNRQNRERRR